MNSTTLGYSFIDNVNNEPLQNSKEQNKVVSTRKILDKLRTSPSQREITNNVNATNDSPALNVSAFGEDEDEPVATHDKPRVSPLLQTVEAFGNYDMRDANNGHYTTQANTPNTQQELLYDFKRHMNNTELQPTSAVDNTTQEKINYIIHMLEQNKQLRTENIGEDMILYFFLGFFVLYISENFVKMGKYTR